MPGTTAAALCPVDVMNRAYGARTSPATLDAEKIRKAASTRSGLHATPRGEGSSCNAGREGERHRHHPYPRRRRRRRPAHARDPRPDRPRARGNTAATDLPDRGRGRHGTRGRVRGEPERRRDLVQRPAHARTGRRRSRRLPVAPALAVPVSERQRAHPDRRRAS